MSKHISIMSKEDKVHIYRSKGQFISVHLISSEQDVIHELFNLVKYWM